MSLMGTRDWMRLRGVVGDLVPERKPDRLVMAVQYPRRKELVHFEGDFVVMHGRITQEMYGHAGRVWLLGELLPGGISALRGGSYFSQVTSAIACLPVDWRDHLPGLARFQDQRRDEQLSDVLDRCLDMATSPILERMRNQLARRPNDRSPQSIGAWIGASREMCSREMKRINGDQQ